MKRLTPILLFLTALTFFAVTIPLNHSEAEDAYEYARRVEQESGQALFHKHHLLYLPIAQGVFRGAQLAGYEGRAFLILIGISGVCGALIFAFFTTLLARRRGWTHALMFGCGLLFSYGFWRYSCAVEIYLPALCVAVAGFWILHQPWESRWRAIVVSALAAFGICIHVLNIIPLLAGIVLFYGLQRRFRPAVFHALLTLFLVTMVYGVVAYTRGIYEPPSDTQPLEGGVNGVMFVKGAVGFAQTVVSGNFLFVCPDFQQQIQAVFPYRMFAEEIFMGNHASMWGFYIACGTSIGGFAVVLLLLLDQVRRKGRDLFPFSHDVMFLVALFWLAGLGGVVLVFEPGNPEMWVMALVPLWWCASYLFGRLARPAKRVLILLVLLLGMHNWFGGMALIQSEEGDYNAQKIQGLLEQQTEGALIVTAENPVFLFYLQYWFSAEIMDLNHCYSSGDAEEEIRKWTGPVYVFDEVLSPIPALRARFPDAETSRAAVATALRPNLVVLNENEAGVLYQLSP